MRNVWIYPYNFNSKTAISLARELDIKRIRPEGSTFRGKEGRTIINWGSSRVPQEMLNGCRVINQPGDVYIASNKLSYFNRFSQAVDPPRIPEFTVDKTIAVGWHLRGISVVGRMSLNSHSGRGIYFFDEQVSLDNIPNAPLYVKYIKKSEEYRVHIFMGNIIDVQRKVLRASDDLGQPVDKRQVNWRVRSHSNGFVFKRNEIDPNPDVLEQAMRAFRSSGLDFAAIDVIWNTRKGEAYVLEANTAPGLEGTTLTNYVNAFNNL